MKAILEFNLPEELEEFNTAVKANAYAAALDAISELLRKYYKYGMPINSPTDSIEIIEYIRGEINQIRMEREV